MGKYFYVASCAFTEEYPKSSKKIQNYITNKFDMPIIRCCTPSYRVKDYEGKMPEWYRKDWKNLEHFHSYEAGSTMVSICHNCSALYEEQYPEINRLSFWELLLRDKDFVYPDLHDEEITLQDCWRSRENSAEQAAVRQILQRMHVKIVEMPKNHGQTDFCGFSLYQPQPPRNPKLAPKRFAQRAKDLFQTHTEEEKKKIMKDYCEQITTEKVIAYCHYCVRGLKLGGKKAFHLGQLLF